MLSVDDEKTEAQIAEKMLQSLGYSTIKAEGREAIEIYQRKQDQFYIL